ncbi:EVE domain-containing protein [bacterium]|nr:EVE domain-containing protein [bacterium]
MAKKYWLMKSEPETYSIDDLERDKTTWWDSIRNYQARNFMTKEMKVGDDVIFYHSNATPPGAAGTGTVSNPAKVDPTQFDKKSDYFEKRASKERPMWFCVELAFKKKFKNLVSLEEMKEQKPLENMLILRKGNRLSITPLSKAEFEHLVKLGK